MIERNAHVEVKYICDTCGKVTPVPIPREQALLHFPSLTRDYRCMPCRKLDADEAGQHLPNYRGPE